MTGAEREPNGPFHFHISILALGRPLVPRPTRVVRVDVEPFFFQDVSIAAAASAASGEPLVIPFSVTISLVANAPEVEINYGLVLNIGAFETASTIRDRTVCPAGAVCAQPFRMLFPSVAENVTLSFAIQQEYTPLCSSSGSGFTAVGIELIYLNGGIQTVAGLPGQYVNYASPCPDPAPISIQHSCDVSLPYQSIVLEGPIDVILRRRDILEAKGDGNVLATTVNNFVGENSLFTSSDNLFTPQIVGSTLPPSSPLNLTLAFPRNVDYAVSDTAIKSQSVVVKQKQIDKSGLRLGFRLKSATLLERRASAISALWQFGRAESSSGLFEARCMPKDLAIFVSQSLRSCPNSMALMVGPVVSRFCVSDVAAQVLCFRTRPKSCLLRPASASAQLTETRRTSTA